MIADMLIPVVALLLFLSVSLVGGRLTRLAGVRLRLLPVLLAALLAQLLLGQLPPALAPLARAVHLATYVAAAAFLGANRRVPGMVVIAGGAATNGLAIALNGGVLPASRSALDTAGIVRSGTGFVNSAVLEHPRLALLGDVFAVPARMPLANVFSIGDILIVLGAGYAAYRLCGTRWTAPWDPVAAGYGGRQRGRHLGLAAESSTRSGRRAAASPAAPTPAPPTTPVVHAPVRATMPALAGHHHDAALAAQVPAPAASTAPAAGTPGAGTPTPPPRGRRAERSSSRPAPRFGHRRHRQTGSPETRPAAAEDDGSQPLLQELMGWGPPEPTGGTLQDGPPPLPAPRWADPPTTTPEPRTPEPLLPARADASGDPQGPPLPVPEPPVLPVPAATAESPEQPAATSGRTATATRQIRIPWPRRSPEGLRTDPGRRPSAAEASADRGHPATHHAATGPLTPAALVPPAPGSQQTLVREADSPPETAERSADQPEPERVPASSGAGAALTALAGDQAGPVPEAEAAPDTAQLRPVFPRQPAALTITPRRGRLGPHMRGR